LRVERNHYHVAPMTGGSRNSVLAPLEFGLNN